MANQDSITVRFELLGRETTNIKSYTLESGYTTATDGFSFELYEPDIELMRELELQPVEILINGNSQVLGRIDKTGPGTGGTAIRCEGRDYLSDVIEDHVDPSLTLKKDMSLDSALLLACGPVGISAIVYEGDIGLRKLRSGRGGEDVPDPKGIAKGSKVDEYKPNPSEGLFAFCNRLVARKGGTIQPGLTRTQLQLASPNYTQSSSHKLRRYLKPPQSSANNVVDSAASRDMSHFPTHVLVTGKQGRGQKAKSALSSSGDVEWPTKEAVGKLIHKGRIKPGEGGKAPNSLYRFHHIRDEEARTAEELDRTRLRHLAERLKETLIYTCTLKGHSDPDNGMTYAVDTIVDVDDEAWGVHESLWVESRTFSYNNGPVTELTCWRLGTYVI